MAAISGPKNTLGVVFPDDIDQPVPALGGRKPTGPLPPVGTRMCEDPDYVPEPVTPGPGLGIDLSKVSDEVPSLGGSGFDTAPIFDWFDGLY
jgi:hypothetical protein